MHKNSPTNEELSKKVAELEAQLAKTQWLHDKENIGSKEPYTPYYGDVTELNTDRTILDLVGKETLKNLTSELMDLLDTSVAIYEKNGDYAYGEFDSAWCRLLDASSRKLCQTNDNKIALNCGKWLCHDDCWNNSAKVAIIAKKSTDIDCPGGIRLFAEPIFVGSEVIGAINTGYGNPPTDNESLKEIAEKYRIDFNTLKQKAKAYNPRPDFIIEIAKKRLKSIAQLIGEIVSRKQTGQALLESQKKLSLIVNESPFPMTIADLRHEKVQYWSQNAVKMFGHSPATVSEWYELAYPDPEYRKQVIERWKPYLKTARKSDTAINTGEYHITCKDGSIKICEIYAQYIPNHIVVTFNDITEPKIAEEALRKSQNKLRTLFASMSEMVVMHELVFDRDGKPVNYRITDCNEAFTKITGISRNAAVGRLSTEVYGTEEPPYLSKYSEVALTGEPYHYETYFQPMDKHFSISVISPEKKHFATVTTDVTEHKQSERLLKNKNEKIAAQNQELNQANLELFAAKETTEKSEENLRFLFENMVQGVVYHKPSGEIIRANEAAARILGLSLDQLYGKTSLDPRWKSIHEDGTAYPGETHPARITIKTKKPVRNSIMGVFIPEKNVYSWININSIPQFNDKNELAQVVVTFADITEIRNAKEKAEESEERLKQAQHNAQLGNWKLDIINDKLYWSDEIYRIFDCQPQEFKATYEGFLEFIHPDDREMVNEAYTHSLQTQKPYDITHRLLMKSGKIKYVQEKCKTTFDKSGKPLVSEGIVLNITKLKEQENKLHQYSKKLEEANATKDQFISILGHDLRSPFTTLLGFSDILIKKFDQYDREKIKEHIETIYKTSRQTYNLLNNLLEWSSIQRDKIPFNPETTNLYFLVYETFMLLNDSADAKQITIEIDMAEEINAVADSEMIKTVIRNLLSNAIKFTPERGKINVSASKSQNFVQVEISDTGTGMKQETLDSLFKVGKIKSKPGTNDEHGTGFGLLLCKEFINKHGGEIWAESEVGKGSDFKFTLPRKLEATD